MKTLTLTAKGEIIRKLDEGYSVTALSRNYGVAKSTIYGIRKKKEHIFKALKNSFSGRGGRGNSAHGVILRIAVVKSL
jgi:IS30 family transposase